MNRKKGDALMQVKVVLAGDQRLAENVILEVRALAQRYGLEAPNVSVTRQPAVGPKSKNATPRRKPRSKAGRSSPT